MTRTLFALAVLIFFSSCKNENRSSEKLFLDSLSRDTFSFFWNLADSTTGNQPDRWPSKSFSSIAATGFGLSAYLVGVNRGYISRDQAAERVRKTLRFFQHSPKGDAATGTSGYNGFFYHFIDMKTGLRFRKVELSTVDTGLLMAGILSCQSFFDRDNDTEKEIRSLADSLFLAVDWAWAMNNEKTMTMGWHPENGFIKARWKGYNEGMILYIMALGSTTHPIAPESWHAWTDTYQWGNYFGQEHINFGPMFGHQYSHLFIDFRGIQDDYMKQKGIDYFENSRRATLANRQYCITNPAGWVGYDSNVWGLTACDGPGNENSANPNISFMGYSARGAAQWNVNDDGTIAPTAVGGSIPFAPEFCMDALLTMKKKYGSKIYGQYGFKDAFNLSIANKDGSRGWYDQDYLGIDQGPILIQLENYQNGFIWNLLKKNKYIVSGLKKAGFKGGWLDN
ncbi:MAG: Tat pathway signal protein [Bacteroidetes bacterium]|nr:Tat pathway signal protein [Bacteroidota bacterium]